MTLREKQSIFIFNVALLIIWTNKREDGKKFRLTGGELWRTDEQQAIYLKEGKTKLKRSRHQDRLAIDLNLFIDGKYQIDKEAYKPLAEYWKSLNPDNIAGYDWNWDANHFEMRL
jgi:hypothetical protein